MNTLHSASVGDRLVVVRLHGKGAIRRRMMDMGLTKGARLLVSKVAPLGDPIELELRGYRLSLRRKEASMVEVEKEDAGWK